MDDLLNDFLAETADILAEASGLIVAWEADPADRDRLDSIFRYVHTIKGSSAFLDLPRTTALAHAAEGALDLVRQGKRAADAGLVSAVLAILDQLSTLCAALAAAGVEPAGDDRAAIAALAGQSDVDPSRQPTAAERGDQNAARDHAVPVDAQGWRSIRVPLFLVDSVMTGVTDIVLARNEFARLLRESGAAPSLISSFERLSESITVMRQSVSQMRMQRIDKLFAPLPRITRDLAQEMGKKIRLISVGGDVELDREMMENIRDPLVHIVRNAVDHGVEAPGERVQAGKDATATVTITARQSGNQIEVSVRDDGRGLVADNLVAKAVAAGIVTPEKLPLLTSKEKLELIFHPGFSTASQVTAISGRGVGMDIVKSNLEKIGGQVELHNDEGQGLAIVMRVPMTLTIISALMVRAAGQYFAIPRSSVREILLETNDAVRIDCVGGGDMVTLRGEQMPMVRLEDILARDATACDESDDRAVVIVRPARGQRYALSVAAIHDHEELVVKPAAPMIMATGLYAGTTLPDNGRPVLLLDMQGLVTAANITAVVARQPRDHAAETAAALAARTVEQLLLFRDMDGRLRAIRLGVVERVEEVPASTLFEAAGTIRVQIGDAIFPVHASRYPDHQKAVKLLRLNDGHRVVCYPIDAVIDIVAMPDKLVPAGAPGLIAAAMLIDNQPAELIDPFWLMGQHGLDAPSDAARPLRCQLSGDDDGWGRNFLAPIVAQAGYQLVSESDDPETHADSAPDIMLCLNSDEANGPAGNGNVPMVRLRASAIAAGPADDSVYRYDRQTLLDTMRRRTGQSAHD